MYRSPTRRGGQDEYNPCQVNDARKLVRNSLCDHYEDPISLRKIKSDNGYCASIKAIAVTMIPDYKIGGRVWLVTTTDDSTGRVGCHYFHLDRVPSLNRM